MLGDLEGAADHLRSLDGVTGRVGCIGFCMGGRYTLLFACASDKLDAAVDCWGGFIDRSTPEERSTATRPTPPLELVAEQLDCPLLAAVGAEDRNPSPRARRAAARGGARLPRRPQRPGDRSRRLRAAPATPSSPTTAQTYRPEPAARLWAEIVPFLSRHLQSG